MSAKDLVSARSAADTDVAITSVLSDQASEAVRDERGGRWHLDHDRERIEAVAKHQRALDEASRCLMVGCIDGIVVGYGLSYLSDAVQGRIAMIDELVVHPDAQAIGVGSAILAEIEDWARANDCAAIESQVLPGNRAAKNFFERVGMKTRKMRVSADL